MCITFFDHTFDLSMTFYKFKRALTFSVVILLVFCHSHHFGMHVMTFKKLLRFLTRPPVQTNGFKGLVAYGTCKCDSHKSELGS